MTNKYYVTNAYYFLPLSTTQLNQISQELQVLAKQHDLIGSVLLASEGFNIGLAAQNRETVKNAKTEILRIFALKELTFKDHTSDIAPYRRFRVQMKDNIVNIGQMQLAESLNHTHVSPEKWHELLNDENVVVLDTRNNYEFEVGKFKKAQHLDIEEFQEFGDKLKQSELPKDKTYLIYCTGGIRCEKAVVEMHNQGYQNVLQLQGGIFKYLEKFPNQGFEGECFVFDHRVAIDQKGERSQKHSICPHTGLVGSTLITCVRCGHNAYIHESCLSDPTQNTCSKNCAYHYRLNPHKKGRRQVRDFELRSGN